MNKSTRNILTICCIFFLTLSCTNSKTEENTKRSNNQDSTIQNIDSTPKDGLLDIGFELMKTESLGDLKLELRIEKIKELFGEPQEKTKPEIMAVDGEYRQDWKYPTKGIELTLKGEVDSTRTIDRITIKKPCELKTKKNIGIGSEFEKVQSAYLNKIDKSASNNEYIIVGTIYGGLIFKFKEKKVESIFIGASAE